MRIVHLADVHLDRPFIGLSLHAARDRRRDLFEAFRRCLDVARDRKAELVTIGGDLWEDENVTPDTRASVAYELSQLPVPVVIVAGNHDPYLRGGAYQRTDWPPNVHVIDSAQPVGVQVADEVTVCGCSWTERPLTSAFLRDGTLRLGGGKHLLLIHGTARHQMLGIQGSHCPFDPADATAAGFAAVLCGHIHASSNCDGVIYPGSPEPLDHTEVGRHCCAVVDVTETGVEVDLVDVNRRRYIARTVDCTEAASGAEVETRVREALASDADPNTVVRVTLTGETGPDCSVDRELIAGRLHEQFLAAIIADGTEPHVDYNEIARRRSADGLFVAELTKRIERAVEERERRVAELALRAGVRAMTGHRDVLNVG